MAYHDSGVDSAVQYCECPLGYGGHKCELQKAECESGGLVCFNGGTCKAKNPGAEFAADATYACECAAGYGGAHCENKQMKCSDALTCFNGGVCTNSTTASPLGQFCECPSGFEGALCEVKAERCTPNLSCYNGGKCMISESNEHFCECGSKYGGLQCEFAKVQCHGGLVSCLNGGWCVDENESDPNSLQKCECKSPFEGASCQFRKTSSGQEEESLPQSNVDTTNREEKPSNLTQSITIKDEAIWSGVAIAFMALFVSSFAVTIYYIRKQNATAETMTFQNKSNPPHEAFIIDDTAAAKTAASTTVV